MASLLARARGSASCRWFLQSRAAFFSLFFTLVVVKVGGVTDVFLWMKLQSRRVQRGAADLLRSSSLVSLQRSVSQQDHDSCIIERSSSCEEFKESDVLVRLTVPVLWDQNLNFMDQLLQEVTSSEAA
ncbi:hypothetical protein FQA47_015080 [Oryzias melastigma]|uniref:Uncharacterized protein n=1 Tax=Oryzias melastigma TaxID=30732 RepID=A0A834FM62_ORYME|nr:hypothetical protein FQA47_015080 [Oryzias melastigma]